MLSLQSNLPLFLPFFILVVYTDKWEIYKLFFEEAPVALTVVEENGLISYANKKFAELTKYPIYEIIGEHFTKFVVPEDRQKMEKYHEKRIKGEKVEEEYEYKCLCKDGEERYVRIKVIRLPENRTLSCKIDVTEEKKAKEIEEIFKKIANTTTVGIFIYQNDYFVYANPAVARLTGYSYEELKQMKFWQLVHENVREEIKERGKIREKGIAVEPETYEIPYYTKEGKTRWALVSFSNITYRGKPAVLATATDITEIREIHEREKKFIEDISHYFFNPICIAKGYVDLISEKVGEEEEIILMKAKEAITRVENVIINLIRRGGING